MSTTGLISLLQVFQPIDLATEGEALKTTQALVQLIYKDVQEDIEGFAKEICQECIEILREPEKSQARGAIKILCALISTTRMPFLGIPGS